MPFFFFWLPVPVLGVVEVLTEGVKVGGPKIEEMIDELIPVGEVVVPTVGETADKLGAAITVGFVLYVDEVEDELN